jgi:O-antigen/teichoic acid export membrane protein
MRWSGLSAVGREASRTVFTIMLARLVGPEAFGIVAQAAVYIGIIGLLLDQGFSSALIQRRTVEPDMPGAIVTVNLAVGAALTALTIAIAPAWASFMSTDALTLVLVVMAPTQLIRAATITPRAMLMRSMQFRKIGIADITSAGAGGALGVLVALLGGSYWAIVVQIVSTDVVLMLMFFAVGAGTWPNLHLRRLKEVAGYSWRAFAAGLLINSVSRNIDNLLVGRFQGAQALAFYGLAYRLLLLPVQLTCNTIGNVLFPAFSRLAHDLAALRTELARATRALAMLALPTMALVAAAAPQVVPLLFGGQWRPAVPIVQVLAMAGAMQAIYQPSTIPVVLGLGHAKLNLRYAWLTTFMFTAGIVAGLPFGPFGVAFGYSVAAGLIVPIEWWIRRHLLHVSMRAQAAILVPALHVAAWAAGGYLLVAVAITGYDWIVLVLGLLLAAVAGLGVLRVVHRAQLAELLHMANRILGRGRPEPSPVPETAGQLP